MDWIDWTCVVVLIDMALGFLIWGGAYLVRLHDERIRKLDELDHEVRILRTRIENMRQLDLVAMQGRLVRLEDEVGFEPRA